MVLPNGQFVGQLWWKSHVLTGPPLLVNISLIAVFCNIPQFCCQRFSRNIPIPSLSILHIVCYYPAARWELRSHGYPYSRFSMKKSKKLRWETPTPIPMKSPMPLYPHAPCFGKGNYPVLSNIITNIFPIWYAYIHTYLPTYLHTYIHTHIYITRTQLFYFMTWFTETIPWWIDMYVIYTSRKHV